MKSSYIWPQYCTFNLILFYVFFRVEKLWLEELSNKGPEKASFARVIFKAVRTRVLISALTIILSVTFSFAAPVSINLYNSLISNKLIAYNNSFMFV